MITFIPREELTKPQGGEVFHLSFQGQGSKPYLLTPKNFVIADDERYLGLLCHLFSIILSSFVPFIMNLSYNNK